MVKFSAKSITIEVNAYHVVIQLFLWMSFIITCLFAFKHFNQSNPWVFGDWLINYSGGFVRRGLFGELAMLIGGGDFYAAKVVVLIFQVVCYGVYFYFSYKLLKSVNNDVSAYILIVFSPFLFVFQINDFQGGFRKEIVYFALLSVTCWFARNDAAFSRYMQLVIVLAFYPVLILGHEMLAVFLPLVLVSFKDVFCLGRERSSARFAFLLVLLAVNVFVFAIALAYRGDSNVVSAICGSLSDFCGAGGGDGGAIGWLQYDFHYGMAQVSNNLLTLEHLAKFSMLLFLSFLSLLPIRGRIFSLLINRVNAFLVLVSIAGTIVLMSAAIDWGRFIYIWLVSLFLLSLVSLKEKNSFASHVEFGYGRLVFAAVYFFGWRLLHSCDEPIWYFYGRVVKFFL